MIHRVVPAIQYSRQTQANESSWRHRSRARPALVTLASAGLALASTAAHLPEVMAHQTQISDGVGGTHHIEPNDTPRAGEPSQTWFALTQAGGKSIGLSDCNCKLAVVEASGEIIAQPSLSAIAVEGLTDVPAAEVTFPTVGAYVLQLSGEPKEAGTFSAFQLDFPVTVAVGQAAVDASPTSEPESTGTVESGQPTTAASGQATSGQIETAEATETAAIADMQPWIWTIAAAGLGIIGTAIIWQRNRA